MSILDPRDFGAKADGAALDTDALQRTIDAAGPGDVVRLDRGTFRTGTLALKSGITLEITPLAVLEGSRDLADYRDCGFHHLEMGETTSLLYALGAHDITLCGGGAIRMNGDAFMDYATFLPDGIDPATLTAAHVDQMVVARNKRPTQPIFFDSCQNVRVRNLAVYDAPCWTFTFSNCDRVVFENMVVRNGKRIANCDGVHFCSSRDVRVSDCVFDCADDCFAATGITHPDIPCENIVVERCRMSSRSAAIRFGHLYSKVRHARVRDIVVERSNRGLCVFAGDGGEVSDIVVENLSAETRIFSGWWWGKGEPFVICAAHSTGSVHDVTLDGCRFDAENPGVVAGTNGNVRNVAIRNCSFAPKPEGWLSQAHPSDVGRMDLQPNCPELLPAPWKAGDDVWVSGADDIRICHI